MIVVNTVNNKVRYAIPKLNIINFNYTIDDDKVWVKYFENGTVKSLCVKETLDEVVTMYNEK